MTAEQSVVVHGRGAVPPRIIVPQDVILKMAQAQAQRLLGDTLGALLEAQFAIRTFVKASAPPPPPAGKKGAKAGGGAGE